MYKRIIFFAICVSLILANHPLSFEEAFQRRLAIDKDLASLGQQQSAAQIDVELATAYNSTEFETVLEDFGQDEIEIAATQVLEFPSIRKNRRQVAESKRKTLHIETENLQVQIHHDLSMYYLQSARIHQELALSRNRLDMSTNILAWQERQFREGALSESELIRTRYEIAGLEVEVQMLELSYSHLAEELGLYLGMVVSTDDLVTDFQTFPELGEIISTWDKLESAPALKRQQAQINVLKADRQAAEVPMISSIGLTAGMKFLPQLDERFPVVGLAIETPIFSKRSKSVEQSEYHLRSGLDRLESINMAFKISSKHWLNQWNMNSNQLKSMQETLIPEAERLYSRIEDEYRGGARQYLEVLNTRSLLTDLQHKELLLHTELASLLFELNLLLGVTIYEFD